MAPKLIQRLTTGFYPLGSLILVLFLSFALLGEVTENSARFERLYTFLLILNGIGILILLGMIGANLQGLMRQLRQHTPGARLTRRLVIIFVLLALLPVSAVYYYSIQFLHRSIDSWFDVRIENALSDALELSRNALNLRMTGSLRVVRQAAERIADAPESTLSLTLNELRERIDARELTLFSPGGRILAFSHTDPGVIVPDIPGEAAFSQMQRGIEYLQLEPAPEALYIRAISTLPSGPIMGEKRYLQGLFLVPGRPNELADSVQIAYGQYKELAYLRTPLKYSFTVTLSMILFLSLLAAVWAAFFSATRLVAPIRDLAAGTRAVASGEYGRQLPKAGHDELGQLIHSFNDMSRRIAHARDTARQSRQEAEDQRAYLETVLGHLNSGVITIDSELQLRATNSSADLILGIDSEAWIGQSLAAAEQAHPHLAPFTELLRAHRQDPRQLWQQECVILTPQGRKTLLCRGSRLPERGEIHEYVVVFDDITTLIRAQRDAAWSEVARRLAHEIKNPLTPIRLSAERLRDKYLADMGPEQGELLDRYTQTITQQVDAMRAMVDAFSTYARSPQLSLSQLDLNALVTEVCELYRHEGNQIETDLAPALPPLQADSHRLRQVLHNLIKNALEATPEGQQAEITLRTTLIDTHGQWLQLEITDSGCGFEVELIDRLFEPYVTTKPKGTGLGLAIVQKIVEEHHGEIQIANRHQAGARVQIRLPLSHEQHSP